MKVEDLNSNYSHFGGKGDVWSDTVHISKRDFSGVTLCGKPMLSHNWARIDKHPTIGCQACLDIYSKEITEIVNHEIEKLNEDKN